MHSKEIDRLGAINVNKYGSKMKVHTYNNAIDIIVEFINSGEKLHTTWLSFSNGTARSVFDKTVFNVGFIGSGDHKVTKNGEYTPHYLSWNKMLQRCYDSKMHKRLPTYKDCSVCDEWLNFQNFADWYEKNYYEIIGERMNLDKDILVKGNKIYSPDTCVFVPHSINGLFVKNNSRRGNLPIGVSRERNNNKFKAKCNNGKKKAIGLGYFDTSKEAFLAYKAFKENLIKSIAFEYKEKIPSVLFNAMLKYEVEETD